MVSMIDTESQPVLPERFEIVNGEVVEMPDMGAFAGEIANRIRDELAVYGAATKQGRPRMDILYRLPISGDATRNRRPDVAFISFERWPKDQAISYRGNPIDVVPELMVEVASPTDTADDLFAKAQEYLQAGSLVAWIVIPRVRQAFVFEPNRLPRVIGEAGHLDGGAAYPNLSVAMSDVFPPSRD